MHVTRTIPIAFLDRFDSLTWPDVKLGLREAWLAPQSAVDIAIRNLLEGSNDPDEAELAGLVTNQLAEAAEIVSRLARAALDHDPKESRMIWLRLLVAWIYENRNAIEDPFDEIFALFPDGVRRALGGY